MNLTKTFYNYPWGDGGDRGGEVDKGEVSTIRLGMLESSGFQKYSTLTNSDSVIFLASLSLSLSLYSSLSLYLCSLFIFE